VDFIKPSNTQGSPNTGAHNIVELYVDSQGALYFCIASGIGLGCRFMSL
jgi:hypothetical protein